MSNKYDEIIQNFIYEYFNQRKFQIENNFLIMLPENGQKVVYENWQQTPFGDQLLEIAKAAEGKMTDDSEGWNRGVVYEGIQNLMEQLFAPPGVLHVYYIPREFWGTPLGGMVGKAWAWSRNDELINQADAGRLVGISTAAINQAIRDGRLTGYDNPESEHERQGKTLVSKQEVLNLWGDKK